MTEFLPTVWAKDVREMLNRFAPWHPLRYSKLRQIWHVLFGHAFLVDQDGPTALLRQFNIMLLIDTVTMIWLGRCPCGIYQKRYAAFEDCSPYTNDPHCNTFRIPRYERLTDD